jgi:uncharacterized protein YkwD
MLLVLLLGACANPATPPLDAARVDPAVHIWASEAAVLIDTHRANLGCGPLRWHHRGATVAEQYARQMSEENFFGHVDPSGTTLKQRLNRAGITGYRLAAETIAAGQDTPSRVVAAWIASAPHRAILEDCQYSQLGLGFHTGTGHYREYWTAVFFATR